MKEIVNRLHENRQIELAKSILESSGYKVSKKLSESAEEHPGWDYFDRDNDYRGPWEPIQYNKFYREDVYDEFCLTIYPPQSMPGGEEFDDWSAEIMYNKDNILVQHDRFNSFEEAEAWINDWLSDNGYAMNESHKVRDKRLKESDEYILKVPEGSVDYKDIKDTGEYSEGHPIFYTGKAATEYMKRVGEYLRKVNGINSDEEAENFCDAMKERILSSGSISTSSPEYRAMQYVASTLKGHSIGVYGTTSAVGAIKSKSPYSYQSLKVSISEKGI